ncbi:NUDIX hydrolase [Exercitatus varius]|uniref:NUDIX hydrolase n=1 Tax=Exercitatus varius TaxID=67857 RepID=UPI0018A49F7B|nr:NUDIX hydrolase [Exercitatus varius]QOF67523.1 NUDIX hydrolase [Actinobacillus sp. GY-402]MDG2944544.1 NUDIX hydrolase [Exercitatus varius]MDG2956620.1 NUDIX hydrolase [Exercitatus varius]MDG2958617.1 NUDIX hydrolase [Exercitatus varius]MDG2962521.1 NUDIX hydrolase [Exercitatus varius]
MHKPNITMACVVHCKGKFLFVEEIEYGKRTLNQPAGHLEKNETILQGASRELYEETGIRADMQKLVKIYQWHAPRSQTDYLRFVFALELDDWLTTTPHDSDITRALWLTLEEFRHYIAQPEQCERNPLVIQAVQDYLKGESYPLDLLSVFE